MQLSDRVARRLRFHDLHVLMAVVQAGSMNKAATLLNTTQPAVSKTIAELEHTVGVRLLERHRQGVEPTKYGRVLLDCGVTVFDDLRQGLRTIEYLADPASGDVRIGCTLLLAGSFVSAVVDRVRRRYPRIQFQLVPMENTPRPELRERKLDLLIARKLEPLADEQLIFEFLFEDSYVVVASAQSPWARRRRINLAQLVNEPWALPPPETFTGSMARDAFLKSGVEYPRASVYAAPNVLPDLLASGNFLTIISMTVLRYLTRRQDDFKVLPVEFPMGSLPLGIVTLKDRTLSPVAKLFIDSAREVSKALAKRKL